jgi:5'-3' exonuclease
VEPDWNDQSVEPEIELNNVELLIDGDVIAYGALWNRWGSVFDGPEKQFTPEEDQKYLVDGILNVDKIIEWLKDMVYTDTAKIAIKGDHNFRYDVWPDYKKSRKQNNRPIKAFVQVLTECLETRHKAVRAHGKESDDLLGIWREDSISRGKTPVVASIDKDLLCFSGVHLRLPKGVLYTSDAREKTKIITVSQWDADYFYHKQLLMGDPTDSIPGLPDIGPKRADAILSACKTKEELQYMVCYAYKQLIGEKWKEALLITGKLITLWPRPDYEFNLEGWNGVS